MAAVRDQSLQSVIISDAEDHYRADLSYAACNRQDWTRAVRRRNGSDLSRGSAIGHRRCVQSDRAVKFCPVLVHIVGPGNETSHQLIFCADRNNLAAGIQKLIRVIR